MRPSTNISRFEEQLGYWRTKYPTDFIYDNENRPTSLRYNGTVNRTDYVYDALGRISSRNAVLNNAPCLSSYGCTAGASLPLTHCFTMMPFLIAPETPCYNTPVMPEGTFVMYVIK